MTAKQGFFFFKSKLQWAALGIFFFLMLGFYNPENLSLQFKNKQGSLENKRASKYRKKCTPYPASPRKEGTCRPPVGLSWCSLTCPVLSPLVLTKAASPGSQQQATGHLTFGPSLTLAPHLEWCPSSLFQDESHHLHSIIQEAFSETPALLDSPLFKATTTPFPT